MKFFIVASALLGFCCALPATYVIQPGDTFWKIAQRDGYNLQEVLALNPGKIPERLYPGDEINVPGGRTSGSRSLYSSGHYNVPGGRASGSRSSTGRQLSPSTTVPSYAGNGYRQPLSPEEITEILDVHNKYRAMHGASPLKWSDDLFKTMNGLWDHNGVFEHKKSGENLAAYSGTNYSFGKAIKAWYDEVSKYDYGNPGFSKATGHFTQVVWKSTKSVACQKNIIPGQKWQSIIICHYDPVGNVIGHFSSNVLPVSG